MNLAWIDRTRCKQCGTFGQHEECPEPYERAGSANPRWDGGKTGHPLYHTYNEMIARCTRDTHPRWNSYGDRGITVCDRWRDGFWTFVEDMGPRPEGHVLDRINNDAGYTPENCRWATYTESNRNRRTSGWERRDRAADGTFR